MSHKKEDSNYGSFFAVPATGEPLEIPVLWEQRVLNRPTVSKARRLANRS